MDRGRQRGRQRYTIGVAADLVNVHQQTLRHYERLGLIEPERGRGDIRYFSPHDIDRIMQIRRLVEELGVNLAGVEVILNMREQMEALQRDMQEIVERMAAEHESEVRRLKDIIIRLQGQEAEVS
ncbi:MAG TPA: MerR family transcriptional regulator [Chloroflexota bacterium]|nr:MerR family transcriptional regulator [Chloroflexota bacterium]